MTATTARAAFGALAAVLLGLVVWFFVPVVPARAQALVTPCVNVSVTVNGVQQNYCEPVSATYPLPVTIAGSGASGIPVTAASGAFVAGFSPDIGDCATAVAWTGTGTPSLCSVDLGNYNELQQPLTVQNTPQVRIGAVEQYAPGSQPWTTNPTPSSSTSVALSHGVVTSLSTSLVAKASAGNLYGFYCNAVTGGAAGYCVAVNAASAPSTGTITGVLDVCYFAAGAGGCSLDRPTFPAAYSTGIVILVTSAASPFTYTTGVDTAFISADFQ